MYTQPVAVSKPDPTTISSVHTCIVNDTSAGLLVDITNFRLPADSSSLTTAVLKLTVTIKQYQF